MLGSIALKSDLIKLRNDDDYYGEFGQQWLSASTLKKYLKGDLPPEDNPNSEALRYGGLFHQAVLEPKKYSDRSDVSEEEDRSIQALKMALESSFEWFVMNKIKKVEVPYVRMWGGINFKCKVDAEADKYLVDLKTTSNIDSTEHTSRHFGYHISCYQYWLLTGKPMYFLYVEKGSGRVKLVYPDKKFYDDGRRDWTWCLRNYRESLKKNWIFRINTDMEDQEFEMDNIPCKVINNKLYTYGYTDSWLLRPRR